MQHSDIINAKISSGNRKVLTRDAPRPYIPVIMQTVSQITDRIAPDRDLEEKKRLHRQIRHWTVAGLLQTVGALYSGPGRHRSYGREEPYIAAILVELSRYQLPIGVLQLIANGVRGVPNDPSGHKMWGEAKARLRTIYAAINLKETRGSGLEDSSNDDNGSTDVILYSPEVERGMPETDNSVIVLNLTELFSNL